MADPIDLTTLAAVKLYLAMDPSDTGADAELEVLITAASRFAMSYCCRNFHSAAYAYNYNGTGGAVLMLREEPVTAVASVTVNGLVVPVSSSPTVGGFTFDNYALYLRGGYCLERGLQNVTVNFTAGYTTIPQDLAQATIELVALRFRRRTNIDVASRGIAGETISYVVQDMSKPVRTVFELYRRAYP